MIEIQVESLRKNDKSPPIMLTLFAHTVKVWSSVDTNVPGQDDMLGCGADRAHILTNSR